MDVLGTIGALARNAGRYGLANAIYGVADYLVLPIGMLLASPFLLKHLGDAQYGVWILASAAVSSGGIVSGSFGDAAIKYVGECRSRQDWPGVKDIVRNMISLNLLLSCILALAVWCIAPYITSHIVKTDRELQVICLESLRIGSGVLVVKSIDTVFISALRALEIYGATVRISICSRIAILVFAIVLCGYGHNVVWVMVITLSISILGMLAQALVLQNRIGGFSLVPSWRQKTISNVASFGAFSWLQAISGIAFNQADRFFVGFFMGASAAGYYGLCVQAAQPIHGLIASGMHCLFPHLSARYSVTPISEIRRKVMFATTINILLVGVLFAPALVFGKHILTKWMGTTFGQRPPQIFPVIVCGFAFLGINVTAHYALLAMGKVRIVTYLNLIAGIAMLLLMVMFIPNQGLQGTALARLIYGPITCLAYWWLYSILRNAKPYTDISQPAIHEVAATVE